MRMRRSPDESGNITLASLSMMMILVVFMVGMVDLGLAWAKANQQEDLVAIACDESKTSSTALVVKNDNWPEQLMAQQICKSLRSNGWAGQVTVYAEELPSSTQGLLPSRRVLAACVEIDGGYKAITAGLDIPLPTSESLYLVPYSPSEAWRPATRRTGKYTLEANTSAAHRSNIKYTEQSHYQMPQKLKDSLDAGLAEAKRG